MNLRALLSSWDDSSWGVLLAAGLALGVALLLHRLGGLVLLRVTRSMPIANAVARRCWRPAGFVLALLALVLVWEAAPDKLMFIQPVRRINGLLLLATLTWLALRAVSGVARGVAAHYPVDVEDNLNARRVQTQATLLARTASFMVLVAGASLMLMTFPGARQVGASLLA